jgi:hypothetical protein
VRLLLSLKMSIAAVTPEIEVVVNPDRFVSQFAPDAAIAALRARRIRIGRRKEISSGRVKTNLICFDCVTGHHSRCDASFCPCVHHQISTAGFVAELLAGLKRPGPGTDLSR